MSTTEQGSQSRGFDPDRLAELEEERRFLLRSIGDLDREHEAGDVDEHDYATLRDGYIARAATVLRVIEDGRAAIPPKRRRPRVLAMWVIGTIVVATLAGWMVARYSGQRTETGSASAQAPGDEVNTQLAAAATALASNDATGAIEAYKRVLDIDPDNVEAITYTGWLLVISGRSSGSTTAVDAGVVQLRKAISIDASYADAHCLLATALTRFVAEPDYAGARVELDACLASDPPQNVRDLVGVIGAELDAAEDPSSSTTTAAVPTT